ncbi:ribonuclease H-like domain-containing protein [Tanacetum coccineum]
MTSLFESWNGEVLCKKVSLIDAGPSVKEQTILFKEAQDRIPFQAHDQPIPILERGSIVLKLDIIFNGDLQEEPVLTGDQSGPSAPPTPKTAKQLAAKRNQEREAIKSRFGGNEESKKMQKNVLKHQFENFTTAPNESLDKAYDRFQKLISQLEVYAALVLKEDINQKFLRS